jgi:hypothetical protein
LGDRSALDRDLPKSVPVSCINREVGHDGVEPGFAQVKGRGKWAIPWMENDPNLVSPQPFVGRMRYDAADALRLGCTGLLGIHWRTKALAGNVSALAAAAWDQSWKPTNWQVTLPAPVVPVSQEKGPIGGKTAAFSQVMADTTNQPVYQTVRFDLDGYEWNVTNGDYTVTLQFVEPAYKQAGKRVFGVQLQGTNVVTRLDVFERVGANRALDLVFPGIAVRDGKLRLDFVRQVEFPAIAGVVIERTSPGAPWTRRINCGGPAWGAYETDKVVAPKTPDVVRRRAMPVAAFYEDFARAHFGDEVGAAAGAVLSRIDGLNLPETTAWLGGPGGIPVRGWPEGTFAFVNELEAMRDRVQGAGNRERFDYWLNTYRFQRDIAAVSGLRARLDDAMKSLPPQTTNALALRMQLARAWETMVSRQVSLTDTPGELGTLANLEQHTRGNNHFLTHHDAALAKALGRSLPAEAEPRGAYTGPPRLVVPTVRTQAAPGEALTLPVFAVDQTPLTGVTLHWRALGRGEWSRVAAQSLGRAVYRVVLPGSAEDVEYYLTARTASGTELTWPPTAPALPQTVVRLR